MHCRHRYPCGVTEEQDTGMSEHLPTFSESGDIKHNQRTCLPDGLRSGKAPQRGFLLTLCPGQKLAGKAAGTGTAGVCLSVTGLSRLSRWPLGLLPSDDDPLCTAKLGAILHNIHLSISHLPQGPSMKACLGLDKQLSSGNSAHLTNLIN